MGYAPHEDTLIPGRATVLAKDGRLWDAEQITIVGSLVVLAGDLTSHNGNGGSCMEDETTASFDMSDVIKICVQPMPAT